MTPLLLAAAGAALAAYGFFAYRRLLTYLHIFQQEEYTNDRFLAWMRSRRAYDRRASLALAAGTALSLAAGSWALAAALALIALVLAVAGAMEADPRKVGKKPLALTKRAGRLLNIALALAAAEAVLAVALVAPAEGIPGALAAGVAAILLVQALPFLLVAANALLAPREKRINEGFLGEAREILGRLRPTVVAVTGSFGKTSTKHILAHVLSTVAPTLATPGSVNTPLGVARIVREQLKPHHRFFVVEMGAYGPGSIARLCDLTPPDLAAITAVGDAHYERFRSLETVAQAKFEIAEATLARGGSVVLNADQIDRGFRDPRIAAAPGRYALVSTDPAETAAAGTNGFVIRDAVQTEQGIAFTLVHDGQEHAVTAPLYGLHHCSNVAVAFVLALKLGVPAETIVAALRSTPQVQHRLQVIRSEGRPTLIDDAYNSNPTGFASALGLLDVLGGASRRRVLVTPGMVELGARHEEEHRRIGRLAGDVADLALVIGAERIPSFVAGFEEGGRAGRALHRFGSFAEAKSWLDANAARDDVVLIENDLPDLYERRLKL
jgi:UDP-N-acetylmuramoyl-tripeptide--D-alanyl-D-alanine ligase